MEFIVVGAILAAISLVFTGGTIWLWILLLIAASVVGFRAYRIRCQACGEKVISGFDMKFCNQCGAEQTGGQGLRLRCQACHAMTRSELNLAYCNRCGTKIA